MISFSHIMILLQLTSKIWITLTVNDTAQIVVRQKSRGQRKSLAPPPSIRTNWMCHPSVCFKTSRLSIVSLFQVRLDQSLCGGVVFLTGWWMLLNVTVGTKCYELSLYAEDVKQMDTSLMLLFRLFEVHFNDLKQF